MLLVGLSEISNEAPEYTGVCDKIEAKYFESVNEDCYSALAIYVKSQGLLLLDHLSVNF